MRFAEAVYLGVVGTDIQKMKILKKLLLIIFLLN